MANIDTPFGFVPIKSQIGSQVRVGAYDMTAGDSTLCSKGDICIMQNSGYVDRGDANAGVACIGVFAYFEYLDADGKFQVKKQIPATKTNFTKIKAYVYDDPFTVFKVQCDTGTVMTLADVGELGNHTGTTGNTTTGISNQELDGSDIQAAGGLNFKLLRLYPQVGNVWGEHAIVEVTFNEHHYLGAAGSAI